MADPPAKSLAPRTLVAEREKVVARLSDAFAHDRLNIEEFERRLTLAHERDTLAAINQLVDDLAEPDGEIRTQALAHTSDAREYQEITAIFGGSQFAGPQPLPSRLKIKAVFGGVQVDLRDAIFPDGVVEMEVKAVFGGVQIIVPPTLAVECHGVAILGGFESLNRAPASTDPPAPLLRVRGRVVFGGVQIETHLPGEDVHWHHHHSHAHRGERRALRNR
ncbi:MAG: LiaF domain-containing protein [Polyangia bacterium]